MSLKTKNKGEEPQDTNRQQEETKAMPFAKTKSENESTAAPSSKKTEDSKADPVMGLDSNTNQN